MLPNRDLLGVLYTSRDLLMFLSGSAVICLLSGWDRFDIAARILATVLVLLQESKQLKNHEPACERDRGGTRADGLLPVASAGLEPGPIKPPPLSCPTETTRFSPLTPARQAAVRTAYARAMFGARSARGTT